MMKSYCCGKTITVPKMKKKNKPSGPDTPFAFLSERAAKALKVGKKQTKPGGPETPFALERAGSHSTKSSTIVYEVYWNRLPHLTHSSNAPSGCSRFGAHASAPSGKFVDALLGLLIRLYDGNIIFAAAAAAAVGGATFTLTLACCCCRS